MPKLIELDTFSSEKGNLTVFEKLLPGDVKRIFYITNIGSEERGGHHHEHSWCTLTCLNGSCEIFVDNGFEEFIFQLDSEQKCLILEPNDWRIMRNFSSGAILLVSSNQYFDEKDYFTAKPSKIEAIIS